ncbi:MAG: SLBB domain-containing protein [Firmicutes bacterium]|nr:SLBB domain-containing protein [Bacillota bacterium]
MISFIQKYGGFFLLFLGIIGIVFLGLKSQSTEVYALTTEIVDYGNTSVVSTENSVFYVDVKGEVEYPGVYSAGAQMRIADVINLAGGLTQNADVSEINLSKNIYDQMVIYIPSSIENEETLNAHQYYVDIKGAVLHPGVYMVPQGTRVYEVIALSGGFLDNADSSSLNLSQLLVDEMVLFVKEKNVENTVSLVKFTVYIGGEVFRPSEYEVDETDTLQDLITMSGGLTDEADTLNLLMNMPLYDGLEIIIPSIDVESNTIPIVQSGLVNINTASLEELMELKGIGIILGQRIIDYRAEYGFFDSIEDIMKVSGIKSSIYEDIFEDITV